MLSYPETTFSLKVKSPSATVLTVRTLSSGPTADSKVTSLISMGGGFEGDREQQSNSSLGR